MAGSIRSAAGAPRRARRPLRTATLSGLIYMAFCATYIVLSTRLAASVSGDAAQLARIETAKGIAFVVVTGVLFAAIDYARSRYIQRQEAQIVAQEAQLLRSERAAVARMLSATLAHDVNNLLVVIAGLVDQLRESADADVQETRGYIEEGVERLTHLARRVASAAKSEDADDATLVALHDEVARIAALTRAHPDVRRCTVEVGALAEVHVTARRDLLEEALMNLIINAAQATGPHGRIEVHLRVDLDAAVLEVHDDGPGIPEAERTRLFEPFYTSKPEGTGLGLLTVRALATTSDGETSVDRSPLGGAVFRVRLPLDA